MRPDLMPLTCHCQRKILLVHLVKATDQHHERVSARRCAARYSPLARLVSGLRPSRWGPSGWTRSYRLYSPSILQTAPGPVASSPSFTAVISKCRLQWVDHLQVDMDRSPRNCTSESQPAENEDLHGRPKISWLEVIQKHFCNFGLGFTVEEAEVAAMEWIM